MLYLFTDFGYEGPYVGQMKAVVSDPSLQCLVIDLMHDVPRFNVKAGAHLLAAATKFIPKNSIVVAVVDPGVGSARKGLVLRADENWYVGPDNGLLDVVARDATLCEWYEIDYKSEDTSPSFHGRDIFMPVAHNIFRKQLMNTMLIPSLNYLPKIDVPNLSEVIYVDHFGNLITGLLASQINENVGISFKGERLERANTFSDVDMGKAFFYVNSQGLIEVSVNCGSAEEFFTAKIGDSLELLG